MHLRASHLGGPFFEMSILCWWQVVLSLCPVGFDFGCICCVRQSVLDGSFSRQQCICVRAVGVVFLLRCPSDSAGGKWFRACVRLVLILVVFAVCGSAFSMGVLEGSNVFACEPLG